MTNERPSPSAPLPLQMSGNKASDPFSELDKLMTLKSAAEALGLPYHKVQRAAARKLVPTYSLGDTRKYVRLRDILSRLEGSTP